MLLRLTLNPHGTMAARMVPVFAALTPELPPLTVTAVLDILAVAFLIYQFLMIVRGRRSAPVLLGLGMLVAVYLLAA